MELQEHTELERHIYASMSTRCVEFNLMARVIIQSAPSEEAETGIENGQRKETLDPRDVKDFL